jgi:hypothetical protein
VGSGKIGGILGEHLEQEELWRCFTKNQRESTEAEVRRRLLFYFEFGKQNWNFSWTVFFAAGKALR